MFYPGYPDRIVWQLGQNQGQQWKQAQAPIPKTGKSYKIAFHGIVGGPITGDIAIDDVAFTSSSCGGTIFSRVFPVLASEKKSGADIKFQ